MWFAEGKWCRSMLHLNKTTFIRFRLIMIYDILQYDWQTILHVHLFDAFFCVSCPRNFWRVYPQSCEHIHHVLTSRIWFSEYLTVSLVFSSHPFANKKLTRMMRLFWWDVFYTFLHTIPENSLWRHMCISAECSFVNTPKNLKVVNPLWYPKTLGPHHPQSPVLQVNWIKGYFWRTNPCRPSRPPCSSLAEASILRSPEENRGACGFGHVHRPKQCPTGPIAWLGILN